jgi:hypothetical protein
MPMFVEIAMSKKLQSLPHRPPMVEIPDHEVLYIAEGKVKVRNPVIVQSLASKLWWERTHSRIAQAELKDLEEFILAHMELEDAQALYVKWLGGDSF